MPRNREAQREYMRKWRAQNGGKADPLLHGTAATYANGCRCDDCRDGHRREAIAHRRARQRLVDAHREEFLRYLAEEKRHAQRDGPGVANGALS